MAKPDDAPSAGLRLLTELLEKALDGGADAIQLEYASGGGLEVCFMCGHTGIGSLLRDRTLIRELIQTIYQLAKLETKVRGRFKLPVRGQACSVSVRVYENFGESAFELKIGASRPKSVRKQ